jgi:hypothetical protein
MAEQLDISLEERQSCATEFCVRFGKSEILDQALWSRKQATIISLEAQIFSSTEKISHVEVKTACSTILLKPAANGLQDVFEKWVERCNKCIACQGRYFEKRDRYRNSVSSDSE